MLHIVVKNDELCEVLKPGGSRLSDELLKECINSAKEHSVFVAKLVDTALKNIT